MDIQNLLESSNEFKSQQLIAEGLQKKWAATGLLEGLDTRGKLSMSVLLENQAKQIIAEANATNVGGAHFTTGEGEQWAGVALPLVRKVFAQIAAKDFLSVQPMSLPSGLAFFLDFKYGNTNGGKVADENMYGNVSTFDKKMTVNEEVKGGLYGVGQYGYSINTVTASYTPSSVAIAGSEADNAKYFHGEGIVSGSNLTVHGVKMNGGHVFTVAKSDLVDKAGQSSGSAADWTAIRSFRLAAGNVPVDTWNEYTYADNTNVYFVMDSGSYAASGSAVNTVLFSVQPKDNARGDFEAASERAVDGSIVIPEIDIKLGSEPIVAKTRKLKAQWTPEFAQDLNAYHSIDAEAEITSLLSEYISMEIDLELLDMLINAAVSVDYWSAKNNTFWNGTQFVSDDSTGISGYYNTQGGWFQTLGTKAQKISNQIHQKTLRGGANFLVCSPTVATILESIPGFAANTDGDKMEFAMGVQKVGSLNSRWKVYKNPYMTENTILMGYKGSQFLESGAYYAPYIPLLMTPLVYDPETFTPRKGIMTRYAKGVLRPEFYGKIFVAGLETI